MDDDKCTRANGQRAARRPRAARPLHTPRARRDRQAAPQFRVPPQAAQPAQAGLPGLRRVRDSPRLAPATQEEVRRSGAIKKQGIEAPKKSKKKSVSDFAGVARIVEIYRLAVMRYKGDIDLWFRYLEFCRERRNRKMKKVTFLFFKFRNQ